MRWLVFIALPCLVPAFLFWRAWSGFWNEPVSRVSSEGAEQGRLGEKRGLFAWLFLLFFHSSLILVFISHLRYLFEPIPQWVLSFRLAGRAAGLVLPASALGLFLCRLGRGESPLGPPLTAALLTVIGLTGLWLDHIQPVDLILVKDWAWGMTRLSPRLPESDIWILAVHLVPVLVLLLHIALGRAAVCPGLALSRRLGR